MTTHMDCGLYKLKSMKNVEMIVGKVLWRAFKIP